jgi:hypothetical protein
MDETARNAPAESPATGAGTWIGRLLIAVILGEGIWGLIVSLTHNLILPLLAKTMGGDVQSPLYLGKGDVNVPALFTSLLELCFAGIVAVVLNAWVQRKAISTRTRPIKVTARPLQPAASTPPPAVAPVKPTAVVPPVKPVPAPAVPIPAAPPPSTPSPSPGQFWSPPEPSPQPKAATPPPLKPAAKPAKPKPPKEVYYNIVGEPINPTEDE